MKGHILAQIGLDKLGVLGLKSKSFLIEFLINPFIQHIIDSLVDSRLNPDLKIFTSVFECCNAL